MSAICGMLHIDGQNINFGAVRRASHSSSGLGFVRLTALAIRFSPSLMTATPAMIASIERPGYTRFDRRIPAPLPGGVLAASSFLGGVYHPTHVIPSFGLQLVSRMLPLSYGLRALRQAVLLGRPFDLWP